MHYSSSFNSPKIQKFSNFAQNSDNLTKFDLPSPTKTDRSCRTSNYDLSNLSVLPTL